MTDGCEYEGCDYDWRNKADDSYRSKREYYDNCIHGMGYCPPILERIFGTHRSIGIRFDATAGFGSVGFDVNISLVFFADTGEWGVFIAPGLQPGIGGGFAWTIGPEFGEDMLGTSSYAGVSYVFAGADGAIIPLGISVESDHASSLPNEDGSYPINSYYGLGPMQPEFKIYDGGSYAIEVSSLLDWVLSLLR